MDWIEFGKAFRELRQRRGITQDQLLDKAPVYKDSRTVRKIEAGQHRPPRPLLISLLVNGLGEKDANRVDLFLDLVGYERLQDSDIAGLALVRTSPAAPPLPVAERSLPARPVMGYRSQVVWQTAAAVCILAASTIAFLVRDSFITITAVIYAVLYAESVVLESAYEYRGRNTIIGAVVAFAISWLGGVVALWIDKAWLDQRGFWLAYGILFLAALAQWLATQPALPPYTVVPTTFLSHTARAAHLKNSIYFLLFLAFPFWILPVHCVAARAAGRAPIAFACPAPPLLLALLVLYVGASLWMGHELTPKLKVHPLNNRYLLLFYLRALIYFPLCLGCIFWYSWALQ